MKRNWLVVGIILLFIGMAYVPAIAQNTERPQSSQGTWLYVGGSGPGNYTKIQDAINNSSDGDTVFVYDQSSPYFEQLYIDVSISLIGENKNTTILDGSNILPSNGIINFQSSNVSIAGFTLRNSTWNGIRIVDFSNNTFINNIFLNNKASGIFLAGSEKNCIEYNEFSGGEYGIQLAIGANHNTIRNNYLTMAESDGIWTRESNHNFIINNTIEHNKRDGIRLQGTHNYVIESNNISYNRRGLSGGSTACLIEKNKINNNKQGILFDIEGNNNIIQLNDFKSNTLGLYFSFSSGNIVQSNNFLRNTFDASSFSSSTTWSKNFWNRPRLLPKPIINWQIYWIIEPEFRPGLALIYPRPYFDKTPALIPYDIGE
ncbi:MAG: right-handed parallel beta-helix repeat-containing protein [Candidatus Thermoplasmatota archaeon]